MVGLCLADTLVHRAVFAGRSGGVQPPSQNSQPPNQTSHNEHGGLTATPLPTPLVFCSLLVRTENCKNFMLDSWFSGKSFQLLPRTRCQILWLKSTKFDFGWGFAPDPAGGAYSAPPDPLAGFKGPTSKGREGREWKGWERKGREGKRREGKGMEGREGTGREWRPKVTPPCWNFSNTALLVQSFLQLLASEVVCRQIIKSTVFTQLKCIDRQTDGKLKSDLNSAALLHNTCYKNQNIVNDYYTFRNCNCQS